MNLLDENIPQDQRPLLRQWHIPFRQIGIEWSHSGVKDPEILPLLHQQRRVTFFTQDQDFFKRGLVHPAYCLVWLDARADDTAWLVRRFLRHPRFDRQARRMGTVARVHADGIHFWQQKLSRLQQVVWPERD